jgi:hypothetical protein
MPLNYTPALDLDTVVREQLPKKHFRKLQRLIGVGTKNLLVALEEKGAVDDTRPVRLSFVPLRLVDRGRNVRDRAFNSSIPTME